MIVIGIDPGKKGGICAIRGREHDTEARIMPGDGKLRELAGFIERQRNISYAFACSGEEYNDEVVAYVENVHAMPGQGVTSMFNFGKGFGEIIGICTALEIDINLVSPQKWKRAVLRGTERDKAAAINFVQQTYPMIELMPGRCRTPQDGIADAVCIAHYGMLEESKKSVA